MVEIDNAGITKIILFAYPIIIGQGAILLESLRILPAEFRIWRRAIKRGRFNAAEILFLVIKYFAIVGYVLDALYRNTTWLTTGRACYLTHYISTFFILFDTSLVALAIAWRTYIIFRCNRKVYWVLSVALAGQISLSMWAMTRILKSNIVSEGYCDYNYPDSAYDIPTMKLSLPYYLMYNGFYDLIVTAAATRHLIKSTGASFGVSEISRVLFYNNIHYVLVVCTVNIGEAIVLYASPRGVPSMMHISCAIQIITAMNLLAIEQDLVHRPSGGRVSHAPNSAAKTDPTNSNSTSSMAKMAFSPSTVTSNSWQTNSKQQTSTFQSEVSTTVGSPLLQSLWHKKARADAANSKQNGGISFEQKKMHFYDDYMTDLEKQQDFSPGLNIMASPDGSPRHEHVGIGSTHSGRKSHNTFIIANPDTPDHSRVYQMSNDSNNMMMTTPLKKQSTSPREDTYTDYIDGPTPTTAQRPATSENTTGGGGMSIRAIRANMESSASMDGAMNFSPLRDLHRPSTSPVTSTSPLTPLSEARKRVSRMFSGWQQPPTFEISPGRGGVSGTSQPRAIIDPAQMIVTKPSQEDLHSSSDVRGLHHSTSKASLSSINTFTSQSALRPINQKSEPMPPRQRSNNLSTVAVTIDGEPTSSFDVNRSDVSGEGFSNSTFGRQSHSHRLNSIEMDEDPFRS